MTDNFEKIDVNQILTLSTLLNEVSLRETEFIRAKFIKSAHNFHETIDFLKKLRLIQISRDRIVVKAKYQKFLNHLNRSSQPEKITKDFILYRLLHDNTSLSDHLGDFLSYFNYSGDQYEFRPNAAQRLYFSGIRNLLIALEFLEIDTDELKYIITSKNPLDFLDILKPTGLSLNEFSSIQKKREEIGRAAELAIIEYEKDRLSSYPHLIEKIEYVSIKDVTAGYDIKSYEVKLENEEMYSPRYVEVKAVSSSDYRFNWSRNEIEASKRYRSSYFLYLLPVLSKNSFDIEGLEVVQDPYLNVYKNKRDWMRMNELISFSLLTNSH